MNLLITAGFVLATLGAAPAQKNELQWFKGNLHTHTWWSDGDSPPETVTAWYRDHDYQFLILSDHNCLSQGTKWINPDRSTKKTAATLYEKKYGPGWAESKRESEKPDAPMLWRAKPLNEVRPFFESAGQFLLIVGEEISDKSDNWPVHLVGINLQEPVEPQKGDDVTTTIQNDVTAVVTQREKTGSPMLVQINHPNFRWGLTAEAIAPAKGANLIEVCNGHGGVANIGDKDHPSIEYIWDAVLTKRLGELNLPIIYGTATDDAHTFTTMGVGQANPGRGWVMVRSRFLTPERIVRSLERGDFYASTGVTLKDVKFENNTLSVAIDAKPGVSYRTQFVGTLRGYDPKTTPRSTDPKAHLTLKYSPDVGKVLAEQTGTHASYKLTGQELYVRARILSDAKKQNPAVEGDLEMAWVQPVQPQAGK